MYYSIGLLQRAAIFVRMDMRHFDIDGICGNETKTARLVAPSGANGFWQVLIDNYYEGILIKRNDRWIGYVNERSELTADDIMILGEMIDNIL